jgi:hypothetical protein
MTIGTVCWVLGNTTYNTWQPGVFCGGFVVPQDLTDFQSHLVLA